LDETSESDKSAKQPDRIATSTVKQLMEESREYQEATLNRADVAATNADTAAYYAKDARDAVNHFLFIAGVGGIGLALVVLGSLLVLLIIGLETGHFIIM